MTYNDTSGLYEATIPPLPAGTLVKYKIYACDIYDNWAISNIYEYEVIELRPPTILGVWRDIEEPMEGETVHIYVNISDESGISMVILSYNASGSLVEMFMMYNESVGAYVATIPPYPAGTLVSYKIYVYDVYDNMAVSDEYGYTVKPRPKVIPVGYIGIIMGLTAVVNCCRFHRHS